MVKYTVASIELIIADLKRYYQIFRWLSFVVMLAYFIFASIIGLGIRWVNISLAGIIFVYQTITLFITSRQARKILRRNYARIKLIIRAISLGMLIYGIYEAAATDIKPINIILVTLMIVFWIAQTVFEIILEIAEKEKDLLVAAIKADIQDVKDTIKAPVNAVKNAFNFVIGRKEEPKEEEKETKEVRRLKKYLEEKEAKKSEAKSKKKSKNDKDDDLIEQAD